MFSNGDDSFDADDEIFLKAAVNIEKTFAQHRPCETVDGGTEAQSEDPDVPITHREEHGLKCGTAPTVNRDPLGLNRTLLNHPSSQSKSIRHSHQNVPTAIQTDAQCANTGTGKRFIFKSPAGKIRTSPTVAGPPLPVTSSNTPVSPDFSDSRDGKISAKNSSTTDVTTILSLRQPVVNSDPGHRPIPPSCLPDTEKPKEHAAARSARSYDLSVPVSESSERSGAGNSAVPDAVKSLFQVGDDWDSDLDLSGIDCDGSPSWIPASDPVLGRTESRLTGEISELSTDSTSKTKVFNDKERMRSVAFPRDIRSNTTPVSSNTSLTTVERLTDTDAKSELKNCFKTPNSTRLCRSAAFSSSHTQRSCESSSLSSPSSNYSTSANKVSTSTSSSSMHDSQLRRPSIPGLHTHSAQGPQPRRNPSHLIGSSNDPVTSTSIPRTPVTSESPASGGGLPETPSSSKSSLGSSSSRRKRKFPGPAGVLPKLKPGLSLEDMNAFKPASPHVTVSAKQQVVPDSQVVSTQIGEERWTDGPWSLMVQDLEPQAQSILQEYSINAILTKAIKKQLPRSKVPVLCACLDQVSVQNTEASVLLRDPTGVMKGTVHRGVVKEYPDDMQTGTVLVLRQVGVFSPSGRNFYLNITPNNLVRIYSREQSSQGVCTRRVATFAPEDFKAPEPIQESPVMRGPGTSASGATPRAPSRPSLFHSGAQSTPSRGHLASPSPGFRFQPRPNRPNSMGFSTPIRNSNPGLRPAVNIRTPQNPGLSRSQGTVRTPQASSNNRYTFRPKSPAVSPLSASPRIGMLAPAIVQAPKPVSAQQRMINSINDNSGTAQHNQCIDNLWQDDQLDDLLSDMGDDML